MGSTLPGAREALEAGFGMAHPGASLQVVRWLEPPTKGSVWGCLRTPWPCRQPLTAEADRVCEWLSIHSLYSLILHWQAASCLTLLQAGSWLGFTHHP